MNRTLATALLLAGALMAGAANAAPRTVTDPQAPRALQADGPVSHQPLRSRTWRLGAAAGPLRADHGSQAAAVRADPGRDPGRHQACWRL
ncbi:hypothetical protein G6F59_018097 [Rhizopus arrhizus]|nr:hypothetical protein G6F59_018097 [Rhizopus arrhizus]